MKKPYVICHMMSTVDGKIYPTTGEINSSSKPIPASSKNTIIHLIVRLGYAAG